MGWLIASVGGPVLTPVHFETVQRKSTLLSPALPLAGRRLLQAASVRHRHGHEGAERVAGGVPRPPPAADAATVVAPGLDTLWVAAVSSGRLQPRPGALSGPARLHRPMATMHDTQSARSSRT